MSRAKHRRTGPWTIVAVAVGVLALFAGGSAYAAYRYDVSASGRILSGVRVAGVDVGDMERQEALRVLREHAEQTLYDQLQVSAAGHSWSVTPASLGMTADVEEAVSRALGVAEDLSFVSRVYHRLRDVPVDVDLDLGFATDRAQVEAFVQRAFAEVSFPAVDARFALVDGELVTRRSRTGQELAAGLATNRILRALDRRAAQIDVPVRTVEPEVTTASLGHSIVVDLSENHLYLYDGLKVIADYPVATAASEYTTPIGTWSIVNKVANPGWYNPALDSWGADLPKYIPPGPENPLGTRALYLDAPGIRIHGTYSSSSIGTYASHGCIRMYISDAEELFDQVDVGARVIIKA